jgi:hypothetical protein
VNNGPALNAAMLVSAVLKNVVAPKKLKRNKNVNTCLGSNRKSREY